MKIIPNYKAQEAVRLLLEFIGEDPDRDGLKDTPKRVVDMLLEMTTLTKDPRYQREGPKEILGRVFESTYDEVVIVKDIEFATLCEHHMLPFTGIIHIGYIPGKVVGLSKLPRLVEYHSKKLQIQERLTNDIAKDIEKYLEAVGVAVVCEGKHSCMSCRGVKSRGSMITSTMLGAFKDKIEARQEFLTLIRD